MQIDDGGGDIKKAINKSLSPKIQKALMRFIPTTHPKMG